MKLSIKTIESNATKVIGNESLAKAFKARGQAISRNESSLSALAKALHKANKLPSYLVADVEVSTSSVQERNAMQQLIALGMSADDGRVMLKDSNVIDKDIESKQTALKLSSDKKAKKTLALQIKALKRDKSHRNTLLRKISSAMRDLAKALIAQYKAAERSRFLNEVEGATSKDAQESADALGLKLKLESGFTLPLTQGEKALQDESDSDDKTAPKVDKSADVVIKQHAKNLLASLQEYEDDLPLKANQFNTLIKYLNALDAIDSTDH